MSASTAAPPVVLGDRFARELPELAVPWQAQEAPDPALLVLDEALAAELGLDPAWLRSPEGVRFLVGHHVPDGARPVAQVYAGHQFGHYSPRLGDGRALLLGELTGPDGVVHDLHLKGSGRTPLARSGDGQATVGPMLREHVLAAAMHALGVPTTRALAVVATGRRVQREELLPGAVLARVASSHLRVGSFQYARSTGDVDLLRRLADHALQRHLHPADADAAGQPQQRYRGLLDAVISAQAELVAQWMLLGFVHGVMNTDNMTISGQTIDYGPCAFVDVYDPAASFSSIDTAGRYAYGNQPGIAEWDLARLAEALLPLLDVDVDGAVELATQSLGAFRPQFATAWSAGMRRKLGLAGGWGHLPLAGDDPATALTCDALVDDLLALLRADRVDHTSFYRRLADLARGRAGGPAGARELFLDRPGFDAWAGRWLALRPDPEAMDAVNPVYVPRNHLVEEALDAAVGGDLAPVERLVEVVSDPYRERPGAQRYAEPAPADYGPYATFCGT